MNGTGYQVVSFLGIYCNIDAYKPLRGSSYVDLPSYIENKKAIINVKHKDNECFILSLCSAIYHEKINKHHERQNVYNNL